MFLILLLCFSIVLLISAEIDARGEIAFAFVFHGRVAFVIAGDCFDPCVNC